MVEIADQAVPQGPARRRAVGVPPPAAVYIAALPRSGSTMLANLLTSPPQRWVLVEPGLHCPTPSPSLSFQYNRFLEASGAAPDEAVTTSPRLLVKRLGDLLPTLEFWGLKEVGTDHPAVISYARPRKTIILVRDIRDALLSLLEKHSAPERRWEPQSQMSFLGDCCAALIDLARDGSPDTRICRYEDLVSSEVAPNFRTAGYERVPLL